MTRAAIIVLALIGAPAAAQVVSGPPAGTVVDTSQFATKADVQAAQSAASAADTKAATAASTASSAQTVATNAAATASSAQTVASDAATAAANAQSAATAAQNAASGAVKTVNGITPTAGAVTLAIPTAGTTTPPGVADTGSIGTMTSMYALANHTHASKARKITATSAADGSFTWTFANPFTTGTAPVCTAIAEVAAGVTDVVNVQIVGSPTATSAAFLVNRSQRSTQVLNLVSVTLLQILPTPGATKIHAICLEP